MTVAPRVRDLVDAVFDAFPASWAEPWDQVGLLAGDPEAEITGVLVSLDPLLRTISLAADLGANVLVTHHPAFLEPPARLVAGSDAAGIVHAATAAGVALVAAHTNLDRAPAGGDALPKMLGLVSTGSIERSLQPSTSVVTYVPGQALDGVADAMAAAGAGRIGEYRDCTFEARGSARFYAPLHSQPYDGTPGTINRSAEVRLEMICDPASTRAVVEAARDMHPYDEPLIMTGPIDIARGAARMGRMCPLVAPVTLESLARMVGDTLACVPRVWGDPASKVVRVATATGSAGSLLGDTLAAGADVLVAGEVRYHDALAAVSAGLAIIEAGHDMTEWPLVPVLAEAVRSTPRLEASMITVDHPVRRWWTAQEER